MSLSTTVLVSSEMGVAWTCSGLPFFARQTGTLGATFQSAVRSYSRPLHVNMSRHNIKYNLRGFLSGLTFPSNLI